ncbi:MAG: alpha-amylase family glycosyl hydrolase [Chloroflexota bacterium]
MQERSSDPPEATTDWWRRAVVYQVYIRSFADADGDGVGDIGGIRARLPYLRDLGVDAIWVTPWYPSPMADGGYDVADYRAIDPRFGTLGDADALVREAHELGLRVLIDIVPNHTSDQHPWFKAALAGGPGSAARARYVFAGGRGPGGDEPPNNWPSVFGGPAWVRVTEPDGRPGQWYLHVFAPEQPDLNWANPEVREEFEQIFAFWLDRGVDGFRIDVAHALVKAEGLPDIPDEHLAGAQLPPGEHPHWDRPGVHEIHRSWRRVADRYEGGRILLGEVGVDDPVRLAEYLRPDALHAAFNFGFMASPWSAESFRTVIDATLEAHREVGAPSSWVLSNHDAMRHVTRFGRASTERRHSEKFGPIASDFELGTRRARAAILLMLALPGCAYLYQGEELGLPEVLDLPPEVLDDPIWARSGQTIRGRDGCRVPLPWAGDAPPFDFGPPGAIPWLPQPPTWRSLTAEAQARNPASMLSLYRTALRLRRDHPGFATDSFRWLPSPQGTLLFERGAGLVCAVNLSPRSTVLPPGARPCLTSDDLDAGTVPPDAAAWFELEG